MIKILLSVTEISLKVPKKPVKSIVLRRRKTLITPLLHHFDLGESLDMTKKNRGQMSFVLL